ncbi:MAG: TetR/AcrR family transcriptional regulator [Candidatus Binatia bacterium]
MIQGPSTTVTTERQLARDAKTRQRILDAAGLCFAQIGIHRATLDDVAAAAQVSKRLIYKHFAGKSGLIDAVMEQVNTEWRQASSDGINNANSATDALMTSFRMTIEVASKRPLFRAILRQDLKVLSADHRLHLAQTRAQSRQQIVDVLRWGVRTVEFRPDIDIELTADALIAIRVGLVARILTASHSGIIGEDLVSAALALVTRGVLSPKATPSVDDAAASGVEDAVSHLRK